MPQPRRAQQPAPPSSSSPGAATTTAAVSAPYVAGPLGAALAAAGTAALSGAALKQAVQSIIAGFDGLTTDNETASWAFVLGELRQAHPEQPESAWEKLRAQEARFEKEYRRKLRARLERDLPAALAESDPEKRQQMLNDIFEREKRFAIARQEAMFHRALGKAEATLLKESSPQGAYWKLSPLVKEHTLDCLAMGEKFWPWEVLEGFQPPVHHGCRCWLLGLDEAVSEGLMSEDQVPDKKDAIKRARQALKDAQSMMESVSEDVIEAFLESLDLEEAHANVHLHRPRKALRYEKGFHKGGEFRPTRGGDPGARLLRRLFHRPLSPARSRQERVSRWTWINGVYTRVPQADQWERKIAGHTYVSPPGGTNVYRDGKLLPPEGEHNATATALPSGGTVDERLRTAAMRHRQSLRDDVLARQSGPVSAPVRPGDGASALLALSDMGYVPDRVSPGTDGVEIHFQSPGSSLLARWNGKQVTDVEFDPVPVPPPAGEELRRAPHSFEEFRQDAFAWGRELAARFDAPLRLQDIRVDSNLADHAGTSQWSGEMDLGRDVGRDMERAGAARAEGRPLTDDEKRGVWSSYWVTAHEMSHSVNPMDPQTFHGQDAALEEALAEELAHVYAVERLTETDQQDVLDWRKAHPDEIAVRGVYRQERARLGQLLDDAKIADPFDRRVFLEDLEFRADPADRQPALARALVDGGFTQDYNEALAHVASTLAAKGDDGEVLDPFNASPGMSQVGKVGYGRFADAKLSEDGKTLTLADGGIRRVEKLPILEQFPELQGQTDGTAVVAYKPGQKPTEGFENADGTPKSFRYIDGEPRAKMILRAFTGKGSPGDFGLRDIYEPGDTPESLAAKLEGQREWTTIRTVPVKRRFDGSYGVGYPNFDGRRLSALGSAQSAADTALHRADLADAPASPGTDPPASPGGWIKAVGDDWWRKLTHTGQGQLPFGEQEMLDQAFAETEKPQPVEQKPGIPHPHWEPPSVLAKVLTKEEIEDVRKGFAPAKGVLFSAEEKYLPPGLVQREWPKGKGKTKFAKPFSPPDAMIGMKVGGDPNAKPAGGIIPNYDATELTLGKVAGGSNGARWAFDADKNRWLIKAYRGDQDRVATELLANRVYDALGAKVAAAGTISMPHQGKPDFRQIPDSPIEEPPIPKPEKGRRVSTGIVCVEPDGRIWLFEPKGHFGGYENTFPKGGLEHGLTGQQNAAKELWEETGLHAHITGFLGDYEGDTGVTRYYVAVRTGGEPLPDDPTPHVPHSGRESAAVKLVTPAEAASLLNRDRDKKVLADALAAGLPKGDFPDDFPDKPKIALAYPTLDGETRHFEPSEKVGEHYMADALLANWDFIGATMDNIMWGPDGEPFRVDQGGTFELRAQGSPKPYGPVPTEVWTMLSKGQGKRGVKINEDQMRAQAADIGKRLTDAKIDKLVDAVPFKDNDMRERIRENLKARTQWMRDFAAGKVDLPRPLEGEAAHAALFAAQEKLELYPEQEDALYAYMEGMDGEINEALRTKKRDERSKPVNKAVDELDGLIGHTKTDGDVIAYVPISASADGAYEDLAGKTLGEKGYLNLSVDPPDAPAYVRVVVPDGSYAIYSGMFEDAPDDRPDLIAARDSRLRIANVHQDDAGRTVLEATLSTQRSYKPVSYFKPKSDKPWKVKESLEEAAVGNTGAMVALYPDPALQKELAVPGGEDPDELHITLAFLGKAADLDKDKLLQVVKGWAATCPQITGELSGVGKFTAGPKPVTYASADLPAAPEQRQRLVDALKGAGIKVNAEHGFTPHITLDYADRDAEVPNRKLRFKKVSVKLADDRHDFDLTGEPLRESATVPPRGVSGTAAAV